ncbi:GNAT family N-acetyltransferase [Lederbergia graminis]|uniref:GNAT family N-acetyltransferase n=1 Tax=Lederbergia graminis TaxID=735518 RepID=A0ABW0LLA6_9BACI
MSNLEIRNFTESDLPLLGDFYHQVTKEQVVFWWIGDKENWINVFCAFENNTMVVKGQVNIISVIPKGRPKTSKHSIYLNLKSLPDVNKEVLNKVYEQLYERALELKETLNPDYKTNLCVGNFKNETENNLFFTQEKGFKYKNSQYSMEADLRKDIANVEMKSNTFEVNYWNMETTIEEEMYLKIEAEIWPDASLGLKRLKEYKENALWTSIIVKENGIILGSVMVWKENEDNNDIGVIEDLFVREQWRKQGIAKCLLTKAMIYLKERGLKKVKLTVDATNENALILYQSVGFKIVSEEVRFYKVLK